MAESKSKEAVKHAAKKQEKEETYADRDRAAAEAAAPRVDSVRGEAPDPGFVPPIARVDKVEA